MGMWYGLETSVAAELLLKCLANTSQETIWLLANCHIVMNLYNKVRIENSGLGLAGITWICSIKNFSFLDLTQIVWDLDIHLTGISVDWKLNHLEPSGTMVQCLNLIDWIRTQNWWTGWIIICVHIFQNIIIYLFHILMCQGQEGRGKENEWFK